MAEPVEDAYQKYLGLPAGPRPPHLYDLLRLELFCSETERIEEAVRKQFRRIKPYEDVPERREREAIQNIMNRIATARVVLTDPGQKDRYDEKLAKMLGVDRDAILRSRTATPLPEYGLVVAAGPTLVGTSIRLLSNATVSIGRDPACTLTLESSRMGLRHGQFRCIDGAWVFEQADSRCLCLVNDRRVEQCRLEAGDAIEMGGYRLRLERLDASPPKGPTLPPISLTMQAGPSIAETHCNALPPAAILIGNDETALWHLGHAKVSRHHCRIEPAGGIWTITDLDSKSGTLVNTDEVGRNFPLKHRDRISIGPFEILASFRR
jgi:pSer/pThr/pTyr-binding forkhead associated (FHA) protein